LDLRGRKWRGTGVECIMRSFITSLNIIREMKCKTRRDELTCELYTRFRMRSPKGGNRPEDLDVDGRIILEWIFEKKGGKLWNEFIRINTGTSGGRL